MDFRELFWFKHHNKTCVLEISDLIFRIAVLCLLKQNFDNKKLSGIKQFQTAVKQNVLH